MSKKDVDKYYEKVMSDYMEMRDTLKEIEEMSADRLVSPDIIDNARKITETLRDNYMRWSYMIYLLNQPERDRKIPLYKKRLKKVLSKLDPSASLESTLQENRLCNDALREYKNNI